MIDAEFDTIASSLKDDPMKMTLLSLFEDQIVLIVNDGRPNLATFLKSLEAKGYCHPPR